MSEIETVNDQLVGVSAGAVVVLVPKVRMNAEEARRHAAWLTVCADTVAGPLDRSFEEILEAVQNT